MRLTKTTKDFLYKIFLLMADSKLKCNTRFSVNEGGVLRAVHEQLVVDGQG